MKFTMKKVLALLLATLMLATSLAALADGTTTEYSEEVLTTSLVSEELSYLEQIAALQAEAEAVDETAEDAQAQLADIYNRLMVVYAEAGSPSAETDPDIYNAVGEVVNVLYAKGYDPYAVVTTAAVTATITYNNNSLTVYFYDSDGNQLQDTDIMLAYDSYSIRSINTNVDVDTIVDYLTGAQSAWEFTEAHGNSTTGSKVASIRRNSSGWRYGTTSDNDAGSISSLYLIFESTAINEGSVTVAQGGSASLALTAAPDSAGITVANSTNAGITVTLSGTTVTVSAANNATVGTYSASYTDAEGEKHTFTINVTYKNEGSVAFKQGDSVTKSVSALPDGSVTVTNSSGTAVTNVTVTANADGTVTVAATDSATAGEYTATYVDAAGVTHTMSIEVVSKEAVNTNISLTIAQGSTATQRIENANAYTYTVKNSSNEVVTDITVTALSANTVAIAVGDNTATGTYTVTYTDGLHTYYMTVTVTRSIRSYSHVDFRIAASVDVVVYNADGTVSTETVEATISNPTTTIYNTSKNTWDASEYDNWAEVIQEEDGVSYFVVEYQDPTSDNGEYEYRMQDELLDKVDVYEGDMLVITFDITYDDPVTGDPVIVENVRQTIYIDRSINICRNPNSSFDFQVSTDDIAAAMTNTTLDITKEWIDSDASLRPEQLEVKVYQNISGTSKLFMTLTLAKDADSTSYPASYTYETEFAEHFATTNEDAVSVEFRDDYGVYISKLPYQEWIKDSNNNLQYVTATYTISEPKYVTSNPFTPVYGSEIAYVGDPERNEYLIVLTNKLSYEDLAVKKVWSDGNENHTSDEVVVTLEAYVGETKVDESWLAEFIYGEGATSTAVKLNSANGWYVEWGHMPVYYTGGTTPVAITSFKAVETAFTADNGKTYTTTVSDISEAVDGNGNYYFTVTNTPSTEVTVKKSWSDSENKYNTRPESITYTLIAKVGDEVYTLPSSITTTAVVTPTNGEWPEHEWTGLPLTDSSGNTITYSVVETGASGYAPSYSTDADGNLVVTNTLNVYSVSLDKIVSGNMGDWSKKFTFTVTITDAKGTDITTDFVPSKTIELSHSDSVVTIYGIPYGATVTITENDYSGENYKTSYVLDGGAKTEKRDVTINSIAANHSVVYTNDKDVVVDTGISLDTLPYVLMLALAGLGLGFWFARRRGHAK